MQKLRAGDTVMVLAGKSKGETGTIEKIVLRKSKRRPKKVQRCVVVSNVNMVAKHVKPNPQMNVAGGIERIAAPLDISNVAIVNPSTGKADRVGIRTLEDGQKVRFYKSDNEVIENAGK